MKQQKTGRKLPRFSFYGMICLLLAALLLAGCGQSKYEAIDLESISSGESGSGRERDAVQSDDTKSAADDSHVGNTETIGAEAMLPLQEMPDSGEESGDGQPEASESLYEEVDEVVTVIVDALNVRDSDNPNARILVQLPAGDTLHRTGYSEEWSRVIYDGETAYVSTAMVEVKEEETPKAGEGESNTPEAEAVLGAEAEAVLEPEPAVPVWNGYIVAIDAGHQAKANMDKEPIGPSSVTLKAKMLEGNIGTDTGVKEHELTLTVAKKLEAELQSRGYQVVMTRQGSDVDLSNAERAAIANESGADIFLLLHANSMDNSGVYGTLTMCMSSQNPFHPELHDRSYRLCKKIVDHICTQTGTKNRGVQETDNSGEINWSEIPVAVVEMGFLSNPDEDRWMQEESYQDKLVSGMAGAVDSYFAEGN